MSTPSQPGVFADTGCLKRPLHPAYMLVASSPHNISPAEFALRVRVRSLSATLCGMWHAGQPRPELTWAPRASVRDDMVFAVANVVNTIRIRAIEIARFTDAGVAKGVAILIPISRICGCDTEIRFLDDSSYRSLEQSILTLLRQESTASDSFVW